MFIRRRKTEAYAPDPAAIVPPSQRVAWYRSDTGVTSAGSRVSVWGNIWGNGDLAQATGSNQPLLVSNTFNGFVGIQSDDGARFMEVTLNTAIAIGSRCYLWYFGRTDTNATGKRYAGIYASGGVAPRLLLSTSGSNTYIVTRGDGTTADSSRETGFSESTTPQLFEMGLTIGGAGCQVTSGTVVNGTALGATTTATMSIVSLYGTGNGVSTSSPRATTAELIIMGAIPDHARKIAMRQYFRKRYGAI